MRIAIANISRCRLGGAEEYLTRLAPRLSAGGHSIAFLYNEDDDPRGLPLIPLPSDAIWSAKELGTHRALHALRDWNPDVVYCNGLGSADLEEAISQTAPSIFSAHGYWGTCVSGSKSFAVPDARPCEREFGPGCLACYYPRRCGGLSPLTMFRDYAEQSRRLKTLRRYDALVVHSAHMAREYAKHGIQSAIVPYLLLGPDCTPPSRESRAEPSWQLLFMGRMTELKGARLLLEALRIAQPKLNVPMHLTLAGNGPTQTACEVASSRLQNDLPGVTCEFTGWVDEERRRELLRTHDLLVVPSTWPEPFGMVGLEAAAYGVPAVAFAVGGIPEWLHTGRNGILAPNDPPTAQGFANAIVSALQDPVVYRELCVSARAVFDEFANQDVVAELVAVFERVRTKVR